MQITIIGCGNVGSGLAERLSKTNQSLPYDHHFEKVEKIEQNGYLLATVHGTKPFLVVESLNSL